VFAWGALVIFAAVEAANVLVFASDYVLNLAQARAFVTLGFWPAVLIRVAFYGVWHVAWGAFQGV
jgi:hypothetical protein